LTDVKIIEDAVAAYLNDGSDGGEFATGWVLVTAVSSSSLDQIGHNGYVVVTSEGLPHHARVGLLTTAVQDIQANTTMMAMYQVGDSILSMDDDEEDED
jgi:hypothetical protein